MRQLILWATLAMAVVGSCMVGTAEDITSRLFGVWAVAIGMLFCGIELGSRATLKRFEELLEEELRELNPDEHARTW